MKKFNWMDCVIILIVLAVIAGGVYYVSRGNQSETNNTKLLFTVNVTEISETVANGYAVGGDVTFGVKNEGKGVVTKVDVMPCFKDIPNVETGKYELKEIKGLFDAHVTIQTKAIESELEFIAGGDPISVGKDMIFHGKGFAGNGYIIGLEVE